MVFSQRNCLLLNEQFSKENSLVTLSFEDYSKSRKMFADKIKELRAKKGMSQLDVATSLFVSQ